MTNDQFTLVNERKGDSREFDTRAEAQEQVEKLIGLGMNPENLEIVPPGETDGGPDVVETTSDDITSTDSDGKSKETRATHPEKFDNTQGGESDESGVVSASEELPDNGPSVDEDPLVWMPDEFTKTVDGTVTITRKGYEVLAHHYDIRGGTELVVSPVETDMEYVVHKATVVDADGDEYSAYGEAHASDNGVENITRMSDTRAYKRAVSRATGVGTVAIEELQGEL